MELRTVVTKEDGAKRRKMITLHTMVQGPEQERKRLEWLNLVVCLLTVVS